MQHLTAIRISLLACVACLAFSFIIFPYVAEGQRANVDPDRFGQLAVNIVQGNGFVYEKGGVPVLERTPLYSFFVAGLFIFSNGFSLSIVQISQAILHAITSYTIYLIALRVHGRRAAALAQIVYALHPIAIWYTARIWLETTHTLLLVLLALLLMLLFESPSAKRASMAGLCIGLSCLTKPVLLLFPFLLITFLTKRFGIRGLGCGLAVLGFTLLVILPWTSRNYEVSQNIVPVNTSLGFNLIQGDIIGERDISLHLGVVDYWNIGKRRVDSLLAPSGLAWESVEGDKILIRSSIENYIQSPIYFVRRLLFNACSLWILGESTIKSLAFGLLQIPLIVLAGISYFRLSAEQKSLVAPLLALVIYYIVVNASIVGWGRYSMPMIPFLLIIATPLLDRFRFRSANMTSVEKDQFAEH